MSATGLRRIARLLLAAAALLGSACSDDQQAALGSLGPIGPPPDVEAWSPTATTGMWPDEAGPGIFLPAELASLPFLAEPSAYGRVGVAKGRTTAGTFGVGNSIVFGLLGLDAPASTLTNAIGPGYQRRDAFFGDSAVLLTSGGAPVAIEDETVQRPRGTAIVRTLARGGGLAWSTTDVAPPGLSAIVRHITVRNETGPAAGLAIRITLGRSEGEADPADPRGLRQVRGDRTMLIHCPGTTPKVSAGAMDLVVPELLPGSEWSVTCVHAFSRDGVFDEGPVDAPALLASSRAATSAFLDEAMALDIPDPKVADLYENALITLYTQTAANGLVSQMHRYTSGWLRDAEGAERLLLAAGLFERGRALLDAAYKTLVVRGEIANSFDLEADLEGFTEPADPAVFWASVPFMEKHGAAESPSYLPLLHALWLDHAGDPSLLDGGRMALLEACVRRQERTDEDLLPFSGDETFHIPMGAALKGVPTSISAFGLSAHSSFLYAAAADRITELGGSPDIAELGAAVRKAADATYWMQSEGLWSPIRFFAEDELYPLPYEDVSTGPLWFGYVRADDERARRNVDATVRELMRDDGTIATSKGLFYTGMVPGMFLANLAMIHRPEEELAFDALDLVATPSGHFEELHQLDNTVFSLAHEPDGRGADISARYRSWEGGDVAAGMLFYLFGYRPEASEKRLSFSPHVPKGFPAIGAKGLRLGNERFDVVTRQFAEGIVFELTRAPGGAEWTFDVALHGARPFSAAWTGATGVRAPEGSVVHVQSVAAPAGATVRVVAAYR